MTFNLNHNYQIHNHEHHNQKRINRILDIFVCISIRLIFLIQVVFTVYILVHLYQQYLYLTLSLCAILILIDGIYVTFYRKGKEYTW